MKKVKYFIIFLLLISPIQSLKSEIIVMSSCDDKQDEFLKNEYILNLNELIMVRNYVYKEKTYQKYRLTDLSVKKSNSYVRNIYEENGKILTESNLYPTPENLNLRDKLFDIRTVDIRLTFRSKNFCAR